MTSANLASRTFGELIRHYATTQANHPALIFKDRHSSYSDLEKQCNAIANTLLAAGINKGDRVGILAKNSDHYLQLLLGAAHIGAVTVGLNWRLNPKELSYISNDSEMKVLFVGSDFTNTAAVIKQATPTLKHIIVIDSIHPEWPTLANWIANSSRSQANISVGADDAALQLYTSGTTGHPKGVVLPHRAFFDPWVYQNHPEMAWNNITPDDVCLLAMPFFHVGGIGLAFMALRGGASAVIVPEFSPTEFLNVVPEYGVSRTFLVPAALRAILLLPEAATADWSSLRQIIYGAAPMPEALLLDALSIIKCNFVQNYGMTELSGTVVHLPPEDHIQGSKRLRSAGLPTPNTAIKIIDEHGLAVAQGEVGEILIRSPATMLAYWKNPDATAKTLINGYIHTGDAGYQDQDGYLYIFDRVKDMIISGGENIYPIEVENALFSHPDITDVAVIGTPDDKWGEAVTAVVVCKENSLVTEQELIDYAKAHIATYKCPKKIVFSTELPRNASGKILKRQLRQPYWEQQDRKI
ncbi:MAG: long-chain-fatty-acid--CoA ligase [Zhongshania sp.]|uniref:long-chain-fatty-acid--CoA ligase n=1 Tax=Zhongshania sp. TaxID=1971902 RepID=UPI00261DAA41|nr:long-chain-fatty-acid--CoA ligase [Zhongshania sp.]MDF1693127.1 long-chain-fatty-acid--CoA ligase [Zhongshania sp.]